MMLLFNSRKMGGWVGGASVTWHVFQSALSLQASHGLERRPAAPAGQPPSLTPPTTPSTSSLALLPTYRAAPSLFGSIFGLGCLSAGGGRHSTDSLVRRHRPRLTLTNHLRLDQQQCQREDFCMFSLNLVACGYSWGSAEIIGLCIKSSSTYLPNPQTSQNIADVLGLD